MRLFTDTEFNETGGALISMSFVSEDAVHEFYEVVELKETWKPWALANLKPILNKDPITYVEFQKRLRVFFNKFSNIEIVANHPNDFLHVVQAMNTDDRGGWFEELKVIRFTIDDDISSKQSKILHNALEDARASRLSWFKKEGITL